MELEQEYPITHIDEVEQIRLLFSKFFKATTNFTHLNVSSKVNNIYNQEALYKSS